MMSDFQALMVRFKHDRCEEVNKICTPVKSKTDLLAIFSIIHGLLSRVSAFLLGH